mmetsp:Transcript_1630/g.7118  ORF Transcript_1630/g.7118 Transcript_1630/m.7118 type:complete len:321 (+) Transcript_1630:1579-2541(+)
MPCWCILYSTTLFTMRRLSSCRMTVARSRTKPRCTRAHGKEADAARFALSEAWFSAFARKSLIAHEWSVMSCREVWWYPPRDGRMNILARVATRFFTARCSFWQQRMPTSATLRVLNERIRTKSVFFVAFPTPRACRSFSSFTSRIRSATECSAASALCRAPSTATTSTIGSGCENGLVALIHPEPTLYLSTASATCRMLPTLELGDGFGTTQASVTSTIAPQGSLSIADTPPGVGAAASSMIVPESRARFAVTHAPSRWHTRTLRRAGLARTAPSPAAPGPCASILARRTSSARHASLWAATYRDITRSRWKSPPPGRL